MVCRICHHNGEHKQFQLREMMFGTKDMFDYFQCGACGCIQIAAIPDDMSKYYPDNYYSFSGKGKLKRKSYIKRLRTRYIIGASKSWIGKLMASFYKEAPFYAFLKNLKLYDYSSSVLDVGSGNGDLLKKLYKLGYNDLTGVDPFIEKDIVYNTHLRIEKKSVFEVDRKYDIIMLHHSLEHMDQQAEIVKKLKEILAPNGQLLIRIPVVSDYLMAQYGLNVVSLDPPRHFYIHSVKSISLLLERAGLKIEKKIFDADEMSFWASEQYQAGISLFNNSESHLAKKAFSDDQLNSFKAQIAELNDQGQSDLLALYITNA